MITGDNKTFPATITGCQFEMAGLETTGRGKTTPASGRGSGVVASAGTDILMDNCFIANCSEYGLAIVASYAAVRNCKFTNASAASPECDILCQNDNEINISSCIFTSTNSTGYCIFASSEYDVGIITNNVFKTRLTGVVKNSGFLHYFENMKSNGQIDQTP